MTAIEAAFGRGVLTPEGALDRAAMRARVFAHGEDRQCLEVILHPMIRSAAERQVVQASAPYVVLVVPLLVESGSYRERCDRICVVDCPEALQVERVVRRNGMAAAQVEAIMASQAGRAARLAAADDVLDNGAGLGELTAQVDALHERYLALARAKLETS
jgi:dephospho-CoA kinase